MDCSICQLLFTTAWSRSDFGVALFQKKQALIRILKDEGRNYEHKSGLGGAPATRRRPRASVYEITTFLRHEPYSYKDMLEFGWRRVGWRGSFFPICSTIYDLIATMKGRRGIKLYAHTWSWMISGDTEKNLGGSIDFCFDFLPKSSHAFSH